MDVRHFSIREPVDEFPLGGNIDPYQVRALRSHQAPHRAQALAEAPPCPLRRQTRGRIILTEDGAMGQGELQLVGAFSAILLCERPLRNVGCPGDCQGSLRTGPRPAMALGRLQARCRPGGPVVAVASSALARNGLAPGPRVGSTAGALSPGLDSLAAVVGGRCLPPILPTPRGGSPGQGRRCQWLAPRPGERARPL
jgi:hypothetical protein